MMSVSTESMNANAGAPVFTGILTAEDVLLTPAAQAKMAELLADVDDDIEAVRVFVSGGGCGGMTYGMTFTDTRTAYDSVLEADGFKLYVDVAALNFLRGVEIDFVDRGLGQASFVFNNVFATTGGSGTCGACGAAGGGCA